MRCARALHLMLDRAGKQVVALAELEAARRYLAANECDAVIAAPGPAAELGAERGGPPIIALARSRELASARALLDAGVDDVLAEPLDELAVTLALRHAAGRSTARRAGGGTGGPGSGSGALPLVGDGDAMQRLRAMIKQIGATRSTALILGESGTGKELVARALHDHGPRKRGRPFVAINCGADARRRSSRASCSATCAARSPARSRDRPRPVRGRRAAAPSSSTRSPTLPLPRCRRSSCASCRTASCAAWATRGRRSQVDVRADRRGAAASSAELVAAGPLPRGPPLPPRGDRRSRMPALRDRDRATCRCSREQLLRGASRRVMVSPTAAAARDAALIAALAAAAAGRATCASSRT